MPIAKPWAPLNNAIVPKMTAGPQFLSAATCTKAINAVKIRLKKLNPRHLLKREAFLMNLGRNV